MFHEEKIVKLRKAKKCEGCLIQMQIGNLAWKLSGKLDDFYSCHICDECNTFLQENPNLFDEDGWTTGEIGDARKQKLMEDHHAVSS